MYGTRGSFFPWTMYKGARIFWALLIGKCRSERAHRGIALIAVFDSPQVPAIASVFSQKRYELATPTTSMTPTIGR